MYLLLLNVVAVIVKATNGPRYVVGCRRQVDKSKMKSGTRVALDMTTLTIMRYFNCANTFILHSNQSLHCLFSLNSVLFKVHQSR